MKRNLLALALFFAGLAVGFGVGTRVGNHEHNLADAQYKAAILAFDLQAPKAGKSGPVLDGMEILLDAELASHGRYMDSISSGSGPDLEPEDRSAMVLEPLDVVSATEKSVVVRSSSAAGLTEYEFNCEAGKLWVHTTRWKFREYFSRE